jgi:hypothetical protein
VQLTDAVTFCTIGLTNGSRRGPFFANASAVEGVYAASASFGAGAAAGVAAAAFGTSEVAGFVAGFVAADGFGAGAGSAFSIAALFVAVACFTAALVEAIGF